MSSDGKVRIVSGDLIGIFDRKRYGPCGRSVCVLHGGLWMTPCEFRAKANGSSSDGFTWKRTIRVVDTNETMKQWLRDNSTQQCDKGCECDNCKLSVDHVKAKKVLNVAVDKDNDSDSGISNASSGGETAKALPATATSATSAAATAAAAPPMTSSQLTMEVSCSTPNYAFMVREAIASVTAGMPTELQTTQGCSRLCVMLYILTKYKPPDTVQVVNEKVRSALRLLYRMEVVGKVIGGDDDSDNEELFLKPIQTEEDEEVKFKPAQFYKTGGKATQGQPKAVVAKGETKKKKLAVKNHTKEFALKKVKKAMSSSIAKENRDKAKQRKKVKNLLKEEKKFKIRVLSQPLAAIVGKKKMARREAVSKLWHYIRSKKLQDPDQKTRIVCDEKLKALTKKSSVNQMDILSIISSNMNATVGK